MHDFLFYTDSNAFVDRPFCFLCAFHIATMSSSELTEMFEEQLHVSCSKQPTRRDFTQSSTSSSDEAARVDSDESRAGQFQKHHHNNTYYLKQMPCSFTRVPDLIQFRLPSFVSNFGRNLAMDTIEYLSYQICEKTKDIANSVECHRYIVRQYAANLLPIHWLPEYCSPLVVHDNFDDLPQLIDELYGEALFAIRHAIAGQHLYISVSTSEEERVELGQVDIIQRLNVVVGIMATGKKYLLKSYPLNLDDEQSILSDEFVLRILIDAMVSLTNY